MATFREGQYIADLGAMVLTGLGKLTMTVNITETKQEMIIYLILIDNYNI